MKVNSIEEYQRQKAKHNELIRQQFLAAYPAPTREIVQIWHLGLEAFLAMAIAISSSLTMSVGTITVFQVLLKSLLTQDGIFSGNVIPASWILAGLSIVSIDFVPMLVGIAKGKKVARANGKLELPNWLIWIGGLAVASAGVLRILLINVLTKLTNDAGSVWLVSGFMVVLTIGMYAICGKISEVWGFQLEAKGTLQRRKDTDYHEEKKAWDTALANNILDGGKLLGVHGVRPTFSEDPQPAPVPQRNPGPRQPRSPKQERQEPGISYTKLVHDFLETNSLSATEVTPAGIIDSILSLAGLDPNGISSDDRKAALDAIGVALHRERKAQNGSS